MSYFQQYPERMNTNNTYKYRPILWLFLFGLAGLLAGCSNGDKKSSPASFVPSPMPQQAQFRVVTDNYFDHYNEGDGDPPFSLFWQFADANYPVPVSYEKSTEEPAGFGLVADTKETIRCWAAADRRVAAISGVTPAAARIRVILTDKITYGGYTNIIGLTTVQDTNVPSFKVEVATKYLRSGGDPSNANDYIEMPANEVLKTLAHELGHALGLGHSPDAYDLMYYQANSNQGKDFSTFLTYGDGIALWTTLNAREVNWIQTRPTITEASQPTVTNVARTRSESREGQVICVYTR